MARVRPEQLGWYLSDNLAITSSISESVIISGSNPLTLIGLTNNSTPLYNLTYDFKHDCYSLTSQEEYFEKIDYRTGFGPEKINDYNTMGIADWHDPMAKAVYEQMNDIGIYMSQERKYRLWASLINLFEANNTPYVISDYIPDRSDETLTFMKQNFPELTKYIASHKHKLEDFSEITAGYPKAMDKGHDGPDAQIILADYIYKQLLKRHEKIIPIKHDNFVTLKDFKTAHKRVYEQTNQWYRHEMGLDYYYGLRK
jgi:hypothetical protein